MTNKLPTSHAQLGNLIYSCIDLSEHDDGVTLKDVIVSEKSGPLTLAIVEDWLRGLPSACTIPYMDHEIYAILIACGNGGWTIDEYWRWSASRVLDFALSPHAFADAKEEPPVKEAIEWTRIKNDSNGNPRYVCHFLNLNTREELNKSGDEWIPVGEKYALALARAKRIGGRKFHNKQYGGGIVFQCYGASDIEPQIERVLKEYP